MMKPTRKQIIEYLERKGAASPVEMAHALHLTPANIRHHLGILAGEGVVQVSGERRESPRGRPNSLYSLTNLTSRHNLGGLSNALLAESLSVISEEERTDLLRRIARRLHPLENRRPGGSQRFVQAVNALNEMSYAARWEARADAPRVILAHCPYAAILPDHPELCRMDAYLLEEMLGGEVVQTARLEQTAQGLRQCVFRLAAPR